MVVVELNWGVLLFAHAEKEMEISLWTGTVMNYITREGLVAGE